MNKNFKLTWQRDLNQVWQDNDIPKFLDGIGIKFEMAFLEALQSSNLSQNPYSNCIWRVLPNSNIPKGVLHCYPREVKSQKVVWEEWFVLDQAIRHHILSNVPFEGEEGVWSPAPDDVDHPKEVLSSSWHYQNSSDLRPSLLTSILL